MTEFDRLTQARKGTIDRIVECVQEQAFVGLSGEADIGKTAILSAALSRLRESEWTVVYLDLDGAWSPNRLAWRWARELMRAVAGSVVLSHVDALDPGMWPETTRKALLRLPGQVGHDVAELAEARQPTRGVGKSEAFDELAHATASLAERQRLIFVVDHLEAPRAAGLTSPDPSELLWRLRSRGQYLSNLHVLVCARPPAQDIASGPQSAYHLDGRWLTLDAPTANDFAEATGYARDIVEAVADRTGGHPRATMEVLDELPKKGDSLRSGAIDAAVVLIAERHLDLARRGLQHARSVHRLGGHLLLAVTHGRGPYEATPELDSSEVSNAMTRLHMNGLVRRGGPREWAAADPRIAWALGGTHHYTLARPSRRELSATGIMPGASMGDQLERAFSELTPREQQVLAMLSEGFTSIDIGSALGISPHTVKRYVGNIYQKLNVKSRVELIRMAHRLLNQAKPSLG